jgi:serine/threonine-protein kinase HipA
LTTKARYDVFLNTPATGQVHAADCVIEEDAGLVTRVAFRYRDIYLDQDGAFPVDPIQLPLVAGETLLPCRAGVPAFIDDYLPDAWGRKILARLAYYRDQHHFNANCVIDSLSLLGTSRIGALSIVPHGIEPLFEPGYSLEELSRAERVAQLIDGSHFDEVDMNEMNLIHLANAGSGVGGTRPKALFYDSNGQYLAKFNRLSQDAYNNARVELACLNMAREAGIDIGKGRIVQGINGREVLLLERFDVAQDGGRYHLITVNGLLKEPKTQRDHGAVFRYDDICDLLRRYSISIDADLQQLLRLMLFNRAINNTDDHERNFSLIHRGDGYQFAPAYDLVPSVTTGEYHAAGYGLRPDPPTPAEVLNMGKVFGLSKTRVAQAAEEVADAVARWVGFAEDAEVSEIESHHIARCIRL